MTSHNINKAFTLLVLLITLFPLACSKDDKNTPPLPTEEVINENTDIIETKSVQFISMNSAVATAQLKVSSDKLESKGFCWDTKEKTSLKSGEKTFVTNDLFSFSDALLNLNENSTYFFRAFVTIDGKTYYGNEMSFTTLTRNNRFTTGLGATDIDGNSYKTVVLGDQEWFAQNLRTSKYNDDSPITLEVWQHELPYHDELYGKYYSWNVIANAKGICPSGWRVPTNADWEKLFLKLDENYTATNNQLGVILKEKGYIESSSGPWRKTTSNTEGSNESGLALVPASSFSFSRNDFLIGVGMESFTWSATSRNATTAHTIYLANYSDAVFWQFASKNQSGLSCRCVRDLTVVGP
jgi:uncharacterized protein (TIGR02145 family)